MKSSTKTIAIVIAAFSFLGATAVGQTNYRKLDEQTYNTLLPNRSQATHEAKSEKDAK